MKLSESFGLLGVSTHGDADSKYARYRPRLHPDGSIAIGDVDGSRIDHNRVREVAQWVSTFEDNDDLTYAVLSMGKRDLRSIGTKLAMYVTDARVVFVQDKVSNPGERIVGHVRYPWVDAILWRPRLGRFKRPKLQIWMHERFPVKHLGSWHHYIEVEFDDSTDTAAIALDLARRVSAHNLAHGAPEWTHDRLREQSRITRLPEPKDDTGEGLWECPASVACPRGAEYIGDSPPQAEWIGRGGPAPEPEPVAQPEPEPRAPSTIILKRMLARGKSIARERGRDVTETDDLLLALLIDDETPVGQLMKRHGAEYESVKAELDRRRPRYGLPTHWRERDRVRVGNQRPSVSIAIGLYQTMRDIERNKDAGDHAGALAGAQRLVELAERSGVSTLRALANVQLGDSYLALGRLDEAHHVFAAATALRAAPALTWSFAQEIDPIDVVDDALYGLWEVADKRDDTDKAAEIATLQRLREFRSRYRTEATAWTAAQLARVHGRSKDYAVAAEWGEIARKEYGHAGDVEGAADVAAVVARACNEAGEPERAFAAAEQAIEGARLVDNKPLEAAARFDRARANKALGNTSTAWDEFLTLLPDERQRNAWQARAIVIQLAKIDVVAAAAYALEVADDDMAFYGPRSAEITLEAARSALAVDDAAEAHRFLTQSVRLVIGVLTHPDTVTANIDRGFVTLGEALTAADDPQFTQQAVQTLVGPLGRLDPARLRGNKCAEFLRKLHDARRHDVLVALARPIVTCLTEALAVEPHPSSGDMLALVFRQWWLSRGLWMSGQRAAALEVIEDRLDWLRTAARISPDHRPRLALSLASYGEDLMRARQFSDAHERQSEAIGMLRSLLSEGEDCGQVLVYALRSHARLAGLSGDRAAQQSRLQEALTVLDNAGAADWVGEARAKIQADLAEAP